MNTHDITYFGGEYSFLSNFYPAEFEFMGLIWPTSEHAYQAMKSSSRDVWSFFAINVPNPGMAKKLGRELKDIRPDWDKVKINMMYNIVLSKFDQNTDLMIKLQQTNGQLIEGNTWGDTFWGQCPIGTGRNELGKILMTIRDDIVRIF